MTPNGNDEIRFPSKARFRRYFFVRLVAGLAVYFVLPHLSELKGKPERLTTQPMTDIEMNDYTRTP